METVLFATSNPHKVKEGNEIGKEFGIEFKQINVGYPEIRDEDIGKIAEEGSRYVFERIKKPVIVEDSALFIDSLNGFPGPYSSYVFKKIGNRGILKLLKYARNRNGKFVTAIGYSDSSRVKIVTGEVEGTIAKKQKGGEGFGYDPIFIPKNYERTFAQAPEMKNKVSHRRKAFYSFCEWYSRLK